MKQVTRISRRLFQGVFAACLIFCSSVAFAGSTNGTLVYSPLNVNASAIPTLSESMIIILGLLLVVVSFRVAQQKDGSARRFMFGLLGAGLLIFGLGSGKLIQSANAGIAVVTSALSILQGGTAPIIPSSVNNFPNNSGVTQKIDSITLPANCPNSNIGFTGDKCVAGSNLVNGETCFISCLVFINEAAN